MTNAYYLNQFISTTLSTAGGIDDSQTTGIKIASTSGVTTDKPGILCLSYSDPIDITKAEWISYTSIDVFNELQGVTRGEEGFSAKSHSNGVAVAFPISRSHINNLNDALIIGGDETNLLEGVLDEDDMASDSATKGATQQSIKAYSDSATQTLTNKTLISPVLNTPIFKVELTGSLENDYAFDTMVINYTSIDTHSGVSGNTYVIPEDGIYFLAFNSLYTDTYATTFNGRIEAYIYNGDTSISEGFSVPGSASTFDPTIQTSIIATCSKDDVITFQNRMQSTANTPATTSGRGFGYRIW